MTQKEWRHKITILVRAIDAEINKCADACKNCAKPDGHPEIWQSIKKHQEELNRLVNDRQQTLER